MLIGLIFRGTFSLKNAVAFFKSPKIFEKCNLRLDYQVVGKRAKTLGIWPVAWKGKL